MVNKVARNEVRLARHARVRNKISGTAATPRLNVFKSNSNIFAQIIDDEKGVTLVSASSLDMKLNGSNIENAKKVGTEIAKRALEKGITEVVFDRGGYQYHGKVESLADAAREAGLKF